MTETDATQTAMLTSASVVTRSLDRFIFSRVRCRVVETICAFGHARIRQAFIALTIALTVIITACGKGDGAPTAPTPVLTTVAVAISPSSIPMGQTAAATASGLDQNGAAIAMGAIMWSSSDPLIATVGATGVVTGIAVGQAQIVATAGSKQGQQSITVTTVPVATVSVAPTTANLTVAGTQQLTATTRDVGGNVLSGRVIAWTTSDATKVTVSASGLATGVAAGVATITATSESKTGTATITVTAVQVSSVTVSPSTSTLALGSTTQLTATPLAQDLTPIPGRLIAWASSDSTIASVSPTGLVRAVGPGSATISATADAHTGNASLSVTVTFTSVKAGNSVTCAISQASTALCWGSDFGGLLGDGNPSHASSTCAQYIGNSHCSNVPIAVGGGFTFAALATGFSAAHSCGLSMSGGTLCWGTNLAGVFGDGTQVSTAYTPVGNQSASKYASIVVGDMYTCALTTDGHVDCWGANFAGILGDPSVATLCPSITNNGVVSTCSPIPNRVPGLTAITKLSGGADHVCALNSSGVVYCWGYNNANQASPLNVGSCLWQTCVTVPTAVATSIRFSDLATGGFFTCALASGVGVYCWGSYNDSNESPLFFRPAPYLISGTSQLVSIIAGLYHVCGLDASGVASCWG